MSVKKKIYKNYRKYLDESFVAPFIFLQPYNNLKKKLGAIYLKKLKGLYIHKIRRQRSICRKLPLNVTFVKRNKKVKKDIIWNRLLREKIIFFNSDPNKKYKPKRELTPDQKMARIFNLNLRLIPDKYLTLVPFINEPGFDLFFGNIDFDFDTLKYKNQNKKFKERKRKRYGNRNVSRKSILFNFIEDKKEKKKKIKEKLTSIFNLKKQKLKIFLQIKIKQRKSAFRKSSRFFRFKKQKTEFGVKLFSGKQMRFFYGFLPYKQILKLYNKTFIKSISTNGRIGHLYDFVSLLESKLDVFLLRSGFFSNIFECQNIIKNKKVLVNGHLVNTSYTFLKDFDVVSFDKSFHSILREKILFNIRNRFFLSNPFNHCEINYCTFDILFNRKLLNIYSLSSRNIFENFGFRPMIPNLKRITAADKNFFKKYKGEKRNLRSYDPKYNPYYFPYKSNSIILKDLITEKTFF